MISRSCVWEVGCVDGGSEHCNGVDLLGQISDGFMYST
jgi:hypothetical protein